ncbi:MAG: TPM domain-containing protein [Saprospiraceae bacterium]|nr:TPM domain-containing protein [Saprospiraceae bacterium]
MKNHYILWVLLTILSLFACTEAGESAKNNNQDDIVRNVDEDIYPQTVGQISDFENILTETEENKLSSLIAQIEERTAVTITVVSMDSTFTSSSEFDHYIAGLHKSWGEHNQKLRDGILIGFSSQLRKIRVNNGAATQKILTDQQTKQIIDQVFIPNIRKEAYFEAFYQGMTSIAQVIAPIYPKSVGRVNDFENILSKKEEQTLTSLINKFEKETTIEIGIVTLDNTFTTTGQFDNYILELHNFWGVGKKDLDNGILIGISREMKRIRINNGFGIEKVLTDQETQEILDQFFIPSLREGDYFEALRLGTTQLMQSLRS